MGSPGTFIHSGTLGGRFLKLESIALAFPTMPEAIAAPPITAPLRKNRRRDVAVELSTESVTRGSPSSVAPRDKLRARRAAGPTASPFNRKMLGRRHQVRVAGLRAGPGCSGVECG